MPSANFWSLQVHIPTHHKTYTTKKNWRYNRDAYVSLQTFHSSNCAESYPSLTLCLPCPPAAFQCECGTSVLGEEGSLLASAVASVAFTELLWHQQILEKFPLLQARLPWASCSRGEKRRQRLVWTVMWMTDNSSCHYRIIQRRGRSSRAYSPLEFFWL